MTEFNEIQREAVNHKDGPMLVLAGPGCGKTTVITGRIAKLIQSGVDPSSILVVTFTRAAAAEMRERFNRLTGSTSGVVFGTFHSIFFHILKIEYRLNSESIIGEDFKIKLIKQIIEDTNNDPFWEGEIAAGVSREISCVKGNGISSKNFYSSVLPAEAFRRVYDEYRRWLRENRKLDFDDIITVTYRLFKTYPDILEKWRQRFKYIQIDEFQDISPLQYYVMKLLAQPNNNIFIVGDDDQSIYRFRGAEPEIMLRIPKEFEGCKIVNLSQNYRSTPQIIHSASKVIDFNKKRYKKSLLTKNKGGSKIDIHIFNNVWAETDELALFIRRAAQNGISYNNIAVLVRTNQGARHIIEKFISDRIPFKAQQDIPCIFDHFIAKDIMAYLNIAAGSNLRADFLRIINRPNRYITKAALYEKKINFETLYWYYDDRTWMYERLEEFEANINALKNMPTYGAINYIRKIIRYDEYIRDYALEHRVPPEELLSIADEITESARSFDKLSDWKEHIAEYSKRVKSDKSTDDDKNSVIISTLHGSKGKEYDIVFIVDVNDGIIPYRKAIAAADIEEERRLFYVGMTRAKSKLYLYAVKNRFEKKMEPSPFLNELSKG